MGSGSISVDLFSRRFRLSNNKNLKKNSVFFKFEEQKPNFFDAMCSYHSDHALLVPVS